ncbi:30S ribosome-binding factor RbfA [Lolliginicoccus levis]|uniref:30S ribosome-binding factor RbfA n=1 Tax=Lolliginicoccus levis TaxID=2919542 RepID=UPI00241D22F5|nr:30S ribosome-binding factor RbfA [Lolliginicoccus levis]
MADPARARRLAKRILTIVATAIEHEIKDPRLEFVTITDARITNDLRDATVFYTVRGRDLDSPADLDSAAAALEKAKGQLRTRVGAGTGVRYTPSLAFKLDSVPDTARHMEELLAKARAADAELARARENATYAGDPDPYKLDDEDEDLDAPGATAAEQGDSEAR